MPHMSDYQNTSVNLREDQVEWAEENHIDVSSLVRELLDEHIEQRQEQTD